MPHRGSHFVYTTEELTRDYRVPQSIRITQMADRRDTRPIPSGAEGVSDTPERSPAGAVLRGT